jgi:hypothetical protein
MHQETKKRSMGFVGKGFGAGYVLLRALCGDFCRTAEEGV